MTHGPKVKPLSTERSLRVKAEERFSREETDSCTHKTSDAIQHELRVHQIELEMQNETLRQAQIALAESRDRYLDLYDFSPVAYLSITGKGIIREANLRAADMLGMDRGRLLENPFSLFVASDCMDRWYFLLKNVQQSGHLQFPEIRLLSRNGRSFYARIDCLSVCRGLDEQMIRLTIIDQGQISDAQRLLEKSDSRYHSLYAGMMDAFVMVDMSGRILLANKAFQLMLGYSEDELKRKTYLELTPESWHAQEAEIIREQVLPRGESTIYEKEYIRNDGSVFPVELKTVLVLDSHQQAETMWAVVRDISARKRAEAAVIESEARYRLAMKAIAGVVYDWNLRSDQMFLSEGLFNLLGESVDTSMSVHQWWMSLVHPADVERVVTEISSALKGRAGQYKVEYRMRHKDGRWIHISDRGLIVRDVLGFATRLVGSLSDISVRVQAELALRNLNDVLERQVSERSAQLECRVNELRESDRFIRATLDSINSAVCVIDETGTIIFENKVWLDFKEGAKAQRRSIENTYAPMCSYLPRSKVCEIETKIAGAISQALSGKRKTKAFSFEYAVGLPPESRWYSVRLSRFHGEGPLRLTLMHEEITQRKLAANEMLKAARNFKLMLRKIESEHAAQSKRIAREVHDQLGATLTMLKLGLATAVESATLDALVKAKLTGVVELANMALQSVKRVTASLRPSMLDTLGLVAAVQWHAKEFSRMTGIETEIQSPDEINLSAELREEVFFIVQEALTNVAKHAEASKVIILIRKTPRRLNVSVADNGIGLKPGSRDKVNSFGLIGMQERAHHLRGSLSLKVRAPRGTCLVLSVPFASPSSEVEERSK